MAKVKGLKRINKIINKYVKKFGISAQLDDTFYYDFNDRLVGYSLIVEEESDKYFESFCNYLNPRVKVDMFLIGLYHEIGHEYTRFNFSEDEWDEIHEVKDKIEIAYGRYPEKASKWNNSYFNLPVEKAATIWGLNYIETHAEEVEEFWSKLQPAIMRFYRKNNVEV